MRAAKIATYHDSRYSPRMQALLDHLFANAAEWRLADGPDNPDVFAIGKAIHVLMIDGKRKRGKTGGEP